MSELVKRENSKSEFKLDLIENMLKNGNLTLIMIMVVSKDLQNFLYQVTIYF